MISKVNKKHAMFSLVTTLEGQGMQANKNQWSQAYYNQPTADDNFLISELIFYRNEKSHKSQKA